MSITATASTAPMVKLPMDHDRWKYRAGLLVCSLLAAGEAGAQAVGSPNQGQGLGNTLRDEAGAPIAHGLQLEYGVDAGIGETDNINMTPTNKVSQTTALIDVDFDAKERSERLDADARGAFSYLDFLQGAYGNELIGRFDGSAELALIQDRLTWRFQDDFGQAQLDPFAAVTPANRENVNYFSTGPQLELRFGPTVFLNAGARYTRTDYQTSPFDSNRFEGDLAVGTHLSSRSSASVDGSFERVLFTTTVIDGVVVNTNFNRSSVFGHYELEGARTTLTANLGATKVDQGSDSNTGPSAKLQVARALSSASKLTFSLGRDLTDASAGFGNLQAGAIPVVGTAPATQQLLNYTVTYATAEWSYRRNRTGIYVSANWERDQYSGQPTLDSTRSQLQFRFDRQLTRSFSADFFASIGRINYPHPDLLAVTDPQPIFVNFTASGFAETDGQVGTNLVYRYGRGLEFRLRYDHTTRIVSGIASGSGYQANRVFLTVGYRPGKAGPG
jgi:hypothetical protein